MPKYQSNRQGNEEQDQGPQRSGKVMRNMLQKENYDNDQYDLQMKKKEEHKQILQQQIEQREREKKEKERKRKEEELREEQRIQQQQEQIKKLYQEEEEKKKQKQNQLREFQEKQMEEKQKQKKQQKQNQLQEDLNYSQNMINQNNNSYITNQSKNYDRYDTNQNNSYLQKQENNNIYDQNTQQQDNDNNYTNLQQTQDYASQNQYNQNQNYQRQTNQQLYMDSYNQQMDQLKQLMEMQQVTLKNQLNYVKQEALSAIQERNKALYELQLLKQEISQKQQLENQQKSFDKNGLKISKDQEENQNQNYNKNEQKQNNNIDLAYDIGGGSLQSETQLVPVHTNFISSSTRPKNLQDGKSIPYTEIIDETEELNLGTYNNSQLLEKLKEKELNLEKAEKKLEDTLGGTMIAEEIDRLLQMGQLQQNNQQNYNNNNNEYKQQNQNYSDTQNNQKQDNYEPIRKQIYSYTQNNNKTPQKNQQIENTENKQSKRLSSAARQILNSQGTSQRPGVYNENNKLQQRPHSESLQAQFDFKEYNKFDKEGLNKINQDSSNKNTNKIDKYKDVAQDLNNLQNLSHNPKEAQNSVDLQKIDQLLENFMSQKNMNKQNLLKSETVENKY
ncbi:hypothetical protein PPERSA_08013 [Pseudocohnilembus persalinus]|uniref:Uncharacterized protein n=1 Tax=Pseudocohnilembus persalinus TaxID=266149 RepID=A0A0V0R2E7_PSEPJ|nr:hypothetical protein PPERSA_08013 [Pseudocohnilembus persalinus]|eukprot:KRX08702.1 hypothetical protein PPERSA_08013 [Pseudocohnilembus persalinus]